jgi:GntR family transcriptional regulator/MocR family aminotransferase
MEPLLELAISLPQRGSRDLLRALHRQLRAAILDGRLKPGLRLPPTRELAAAYRVSRNTAVATYDLLLSEGYVVTRPGAGTYVADALPLSGRREAPAQSADFAGHLSAFWRKPPALALAASRSPPRFDFRPGLPDTGLFPFDVWRRLSGRALRIQSKAPALYAEPQGRPSLREAIARHVSFARAVACRAEDIVVTAGAQQAFDLLARILVTPGRTVVAVEDPGYPPVRAAFMAAGAQIVPVPVDDAGLVVDELPANTKVISVTPSHQFPLGTAMSLQRRAALLDFARAHRAVVIEDDYDGEFRFGGRPLDALQTLDRSGLVFYVGTFSKSLFPALRLGFVVAPPWARGPLVSAKQLADWHGAVLAQDTLAAFIMEGHLARHIRKMRKVYGERRQLLLNHLSKNFDGYLEPIASAAGLHLAALSASSSTADRIAQRALRHDIGVYSLRPFYAGKASRHGLLFGYGAIDERGIREGLLRLRRVWETSSD